METLESFSASDKCKVQSLFGRWTKKEEKTEKNIIDKKAIKKKNFIEHDKILICSAD